MGKLMGWRGRKGTGALRGTTIPARRVAAALLSVPLLTGAAVAWPATSANAEVAQASISSAKTVTPDVSDATLFFKDGNHHAYACDDGKTYSVNATVVQVHNACGTRVWLHKNANDSGTSWCVSKVSSSDPPEIKYANLQITSNTRACP